MNTHSTGYWKFDRTLFKKALLLGFLTALLGVSANLMPQITGLETSLGLDSLFRLRGQRTPPPEAVVVSIDKTSAQQLTLSDNPRYWPRSLYARLIKNLVRHHASVIVFDINFSEEWNEHDDRVFARAIKGAGNVILFQYLRRELVSAPGTSHTLKIPLIVDKLVPPASELAEGAIGIAPFPLPKVPVRISQVWMFKRSAGGFPTLPLVAFQFYMQPYFEKLQNLARSIRPEEFSGKIHGDISNADQPDFAQRIKQVRSVFQSNPNLAASLRNRLHQYDEATQAALTRLISPYEGGDSRYLDFYGPPQTITTIPYYQALNQPGNLPDLSGKVVFVGYSAQLQPEQKDGFYTSFSQSDGLDISGVEIAATAFANLIEDRRVIPLGPAAKFSLTAVWGLALGVLLMLTSVATMIPVAAAFTLIGIGFAYFCFALEGIWLPLVVPALIQTPIAIAGALIWQHFSSHKVQAIQREAFSYYLPGWVVDELGASVDTPQSRGKLVKGVCLATDAEQYTSLSEFLPPGQLRLILNEYYRTLFDPVKQRGGFVSDIVGDSMLAIWAMGDSQRTMHCQACQTALEIISAVDALNKRHPATPLPTRIGLHSGEVLLGNVGAGDHFEYRAVGDNVNTATRIQGLNKQLGTRILASQDVISWVDGIVTRNMGHFIFVGKRNPIAVFELISPNRYEYPNLDELRGLFAAGLREFRRRQWREATDHFESILERIGQDGPSRFYIDLCKQYIANPPPEEWHGVVTLDQK